MRLTILVSCLAFLLLGLPADAREIYLLQGAVAGVMFDTQTTIWSTDALFYNRGSVDDHVTLLGISNGVDPTGRVGEALVVPAGQAVSLQRGTNWVPAIPFVMLHLSVPDQTVVDDVLYVGSRNNTGVSSPAAYRKFGKITLPVFNALVPASELQVHLETDIGDIEGHVNIAVYNAGDRAATAVIETRAHCDNGVVSQETVTVPANTVMQFGPLQTDTNLRCGGELAKSIYTVVTVDQPSLTFVSALANSNIPTTSISISGN